MGYYKECKELEECKKLNKYWYNKEFDKWYRGYLKIAIETEYPLAECQVGYCYLEGIGVEKDISKAVEWTKKGAIHGDRDAQYNFAIMILDKSFEGYEKEDAIYWLNKAAKQEHELAIIKLQEIKN